MSCWLKLWKLNSETEPSSEVQQDEQESELNRNSDCVERTNPKHTELGLQQSDVPIVSIFRQSTSLSSEVHNNEVSAKHRVFRSRMRLH